MFTMLKTLAIAGVVGTAALAAQPARADNVAFGIGVNVGHTYHSNFGGGSHVVFSGSYAAAPAVYYPSGPNYYQPAFNYYPAPVYYQQPAYCPPAVVYPQPVYYPAPAVYYPAPTYYSQPSLTFGLAFAFGSGFHGGGYHGHGGHW